MKKKLFRMSLFDNGTEAAKEVILKAAQCNAGVAGYDLRGLASFGEAYNRQLVGEWVETQFEMIGENLLHIDCKSNGSYETVAIIEEIEVWEVKEAHEEYEAII